MKKKRELLKSRHNRNKYHDQATQSLAHVDSARLEATKLRVREFQAPCKRKIPKQVSQQTRDTKPAFRSKVRDRGDAVHSYQKIQASPPSLELKSIVKKQEIPMNLQNGQQISSLALSRDGHQSKGNGPSPKQLARQQRRLEQLRQWQWQRRQQISPPAYPKISDMARQSDGEAELTTSRNLRTPSHAATTMNSTPSTISQSLVNIKTECTDSVAPVAESVRHVQSSIMVINQQSQNPDDSITPTITSSCVEPETIFTATPVVEQAIRDTVAISASDGEATPATGENSTGTASAASLIHSQQPVSPFEDVLEKSYHIVERGDTSAEFHEPRSVAIVERTLERSSLISPGIYNSNEFAHPDGVKEQTEEERAADHSEKEEEGATCGHNAASTRTMEVSRPTIELERSYSVCVSEMDRETPMKVKNEPRVDHSAEERKAAEEQQQKPQEEDKKKRGEEGLTMETSRQPLELERSYPISVHDLDQQTPMKVDHGPLARKENQVVTSQLSTTGSAKAVMKNPANAHDDHTAASMFSPETVDHSYLVHGKGVLEQSYLQQLYAEVAGYNLDLQSGLDPQYLKPGYLLHPTNTLGPNEQARRQASLDHAPQMSAEPVFEDPANRPCWQGDNTEALNVSSKATGAGSLLPNMPVQSGGRAEKSATRPEESVTPETAAVGHHQRKKNPRRGPENSHNMPPSSTQESKVVLDVASQHHRRNRSSEVQVLGSEDEKTTTVQTDQIVHDEEGEESSVSSVSSLSLVEELSARAEQIVTDALRQAATHGIQSMTKASGELAATVHAILGTAVANDTFLSQYSSKSPQPGSLLLALLSPSSLTAAAPVPPPRNVGLVTSGRKQSDIDCSLLPKYRPPRPKRTGNRSSVLRWNVRSTGLPHLAYVAQTKNSHPTSEKDSHNVDMSTPLGALRQHLQGERVRKTNDGLEVDDFTNARWTATRHQNLQVDSARKVDEYNTNSAAIRDLPRKFIVGERSGPNGVTFANALAVTDSDGKSECYDGGLSDFETVDSADEAEVEAVNHAILSTT